MEPAMTGGSELIGARIILVDDVPANLRLLEGMLRSKGYVPRSFPRGGLALTAALHSPPDLFLLDVNMPGMDGYELCAQLKSNEQLASVPVLFLSGRAEPDDKLRAFQLGGVDYIPKPFRIEEVMARVETHLRLRHAIRAEHELLEKTLNGAVRTLSDMMHIASPVIASRTHCIRIYVERMARRVSAPAGRWQYELAATLSLLGCITLPDDVFSRCYAKYAGGDHTRAGESWEIDVFDAHPETTARMLANIPRLETVTEIVRRQLTFNPSTDLRTDCDIGAYLLYLAVDLDRRVYSGTPFQQAIAAVREHLEPFDAVALESVRDLDPETVTEPELDLGMATLRSGMVLVSDIRSEKTGVKILPKEMMLNQMWIERLRNFARSEGVREPIRVRIPRLTFTADIQQAQVSD